MIKMLGIIGIQPMGMTEESFRTAIKQTEASLGIAESDASEEAKQLGLQNLGWGRYGKDGQTTHIVQNGKLVPFEKQGSGPSIAQVRRDKAAQPTSTPAPVTAKPGEKISIAQAKGANPDADMVAQLRGVSDHIQKVLNADEWKPLTAGRDEELATVIMNKAEDEFNSVDRALKQLLQTPEIDFSVNKLKKFISLRLAQAQKAKKEPLVKGYSQMNKRLGIIVLSHLIGTAMQPELAHEEITTESLNENVGSYRSVTTEDLKKLVKEEKENFRKELQEGGKKIQKKLEELRKEMFKKENLGTECEKRIQLQTVSELADVPVNELMLYFMNHVKTQNESSVTIPASVEYHLGHVYFRADND